MGIGISYPNEVNGNPSLPLSRNLSNSLIISIMPPPWHGSFTPSAPPRLLLNYTLLMETDYFRNSLSAAARTTTLFRDVFCSFSYTHDERRTVSTSSYNTVIHSSWACFSSPLLFPMFHNKWCSWMRVEPWSSNWRARRTRNRVVMALLSIQRRNHSPGNSVANDWNYTHLFAQTDLFVFGRCSRFVISHLREHFG